MKDDGGGVVEHVDVGRFGFDGEFGFGGDEGGSTEVCELGNGLSGLQVGFSVEILRFDVTDILFLRSSTNDHI